VLAPEDGLGVESGVVAYINKGDAEIGRLTFLCPRKQWLQRQHVAE